MDLNEARQILSNNGFITERASDMSYEELCDKWGRPEDN